MRLCAGRRIAHPRDLYADGLVPWDSAVAFPLFSAPAVSVRERRPLYNRWPHHHRPCFGIPLFSPGGEVSGPWLDAKVFQVLEDEIRTAYPEKIGRAMVAGRPDHPWCSPFVLRHFFADPAPSVPARHTREVPAGHAN